MNSQNRLVYSKQELPCKKRRVNELKENGGTSKVHLSNEIENRNSLR